MDGNVVSKYSYSSSLVIPVPVDMELRQPYKKYLLRVVNTQKLGGRVGKFTGYKLLKTHNYAKKDFDEQLSTRRIVQLWIFIFRIFLTFLIETIYSMRNETTATSSFP